MTYLLQEIVPDRIKVKPRSSGITMMLDRCQGLVGTEDLIHMAGEYLDTREANKTTLRQLFERYEREISSKKRTIQDEYPIKNIWQLNFNLGNNYAQSYFVKVKV